MNRSARGVLALCGIGVLLAAADTYVIVLALPDMMVGLGLDADELQRAAPLVSGFLLGYVVVLPLVGRVSDVVGRRPVLAAAFGVFTAGSLITASASGLAEAVAGRFLQGAGGGALVPVTLALVADLWPPRRRGVPLGVVGAVQELGAVLGPLFGAAILAVADWRAIFWVNGVAGAVLAAGMIAVRRHTGRDRVNLREPAVRTGPPDIAGAVLAGAALAAAGTALVRPAGLETSVTWGELLVPVWGSSEWSTPLALGAVVLAAAFVVRELTASRPLLNLRRTPAVLTAADLPGAILLGAALGAIVLTFAGAETGQQVLAPAAPWLLAGAAVALVAFGWRQHRGAEPLVPAAAVRARPAWGALVVSGFVGAALVAVVVDVPVLARTVVDGADQVDAALVLVRFLVALPAGAVIGGWLLRRLSPAPVAATGMALAAVALGVMTTWGRGALDGPLDDVVLVAAGLGFGLAVAPVNAAILGAAPRATHGVASALVVVARMVGMLAGLSALTAIGLRRFYDVQAGIDSPAVTCPRAPTDCPAYDDAVRGAIIEQLQATFTGAAVCAALAAVGAALLLRPSRP